MPGCFKEILARHLPNSTAALALVSCAVVAGPLRAEEMDLTCARKDCPSCSSSVFGYSVDRGPSYIESGAEVEVGEMFVRRVMVMRDYGSSVDLHQWLFNRYDGKLTTFSHTGIPKSSLPDGLNGKVGMLTFNQVDAATKGKAPSAQREFSCRRAERRVRQF